MLRHQGMAFNGEFFVRGKLFAVGKVFCTAGPTLVHAFQFTEFLVVARYPHPARHRFDGKSNRRRRGVRSPIRALINPRPQDADLARK